MKKFLGVIIALALVLGTIPAYVLAASCPDGQHQWDPKGTGTCTVNECEAKCKHEDSFEKVHDCVKGGYDVRICNTCGNKSLSSGNHAPTTHSYQNGVCTACGAEEKVTCTDGHTYPNPSKGVCSECGAECAHANQRVNYQDCTGKGLYNTTWCDDCNMRMGFVPVPGEHSMKDGVCTVCGYEEDPNCEHAWDWTTGKCTKCQAKCEHAETEVIYGDCTDPNAYNNTRCKECKYSLHSEKVSGEHDMEDGVCTVCGYEENPDCEHEWDWTTGKCTKCQAKCEHAETEVIYGDCTDPNAYNNTRCKECKKSLSMEKVSGEHDMKDGVCTRCGYEEDPDCEHEWDWTTGKCTKCQADCEHAEEEVVYGLCTDPNAYNTTRCKECKHPLHSEKVSGEHDMKDGVCTRCGYEEDPNCEHEWARDTGLCKKCGKKCEHPTTKIIHDDCEGVGYVTETCTVCLKVLSLEPVPGEHTFEDGVCIKCGAEDPNYVPPTADEEEEFEEVVEEEEAEVVEEEAEVDDSDVPDTGDNSFGMIAMFGLVLSGAVLVSLIKRRRAC